MAQRRQSTLHLQMGQEVIYLIFTISLMAAFLLALYALQLHGDLREQRLRAEAMAFELEQQARAREAEPAVSIDPIKPGPDPGIALQAEPDPASQLPPILTLSEAEGYFFELGSAALTDSFVRKLENEVVPRLVEAAERYQVDIIEIVGHTDEVPLRSRDSNLDSRLLPFLEEAGEEGELSAADNVGLGMARAAAVARRLVLDPRLEGYSILPLSAGQTTDLGERLASVGDEEAVRERRRIEIRLRRRHRGG